MNNEVTLRTNKGEYHTGETVNGAVYLRICRPTEGCGMKITFKGIEKCEYNYECNGKKTISKETVHVDFSDISLYIQDECFQFGCYVFPFSFQLPNEIPGTIDMSGENEQGSWTVNVCYSIKAWVKGSDSIQEVQPIVVYQCQDTDLRENHVGTADFATFEVKRFAFKNQMIHITVKLAENYKATGLNCQLRLIITNDSKVMVSGIVVKLKRYLKFSFQIKDYALASLTPAMKTDGEDSIEVFPESGPHVVYSLTGWSDSVMGKFVSGGLDHLQVPLVEKKPTGEKCEVPSSAEGKSFQNKYGLEVSISFSNGHTETLNLEIPGVLPGPNKKWATWKAHDWLFNCDTRLSSSLFSVAENLLQVYFLDQRIFTLYRTRALENIQSNKSCVVDLYTWHVKK